MVSYTFFILLCLLCLFLLFLPFIPAFYQFSISFLPFNTFSRFTIPFTIFHNFSRFFMIFHDLSHPFTPLLDNQIMRSSGVCQSQCYRDRRRSGEIKNILVERTAATADVDRFSVEIPPRTSTLNATTDIKHPQINSSHICDYSVRTMHS